jgi:hypothetical protein
MASLRQGTGMRQPWPEIEPDESGLLDVGDGHRIYWEACGARGAKPAVVLHGGPGGAGCSTRARIASCCSTSAVAAGAFPARVSRMST